MRLVPTPIYSALIKLASQSFERLIVPQAGSLPGRVVLCATRDKEPGAWSCWSIGPVPEPGRRFLSWWHGPKLPEVPPYDYGAEGGPANWLNALPQRYMLSVREFIVEARKRWEPSSLGPHLEVLAFVPTSRDLQRIVVHDRSTVDGLTAGVSPIIRPGRPATKFTPSVTDDLRRHAQGLHAAYRAHYGKKLVVKPEGYIWTS